MAIKASDTITLVKVTDGANGKGIKSYDVEFYSSTSNTALSGGSWVTTAPAWANGKYIWSRNKITYTDNTSVTTKEVCITGGIGPTGGTGGTGATGTGVESITEEYYLSTSKTTQSGGSWVTTAPTWSTGKYMWSRVKIVYKNPASTAYTTPVCDSSWEAVNEIEIGVTNYLVHSDVTYKLTNKSQAVSITMGVWPSLDLKSVLTNEFTLSFYVDTPGEHKTSGPGDINDRFGMHGNAMFKKTDGTTTTNYPFDVLLKPFGKKGRQSLSYKIPLPAGCTELINLRFSLQLTALPADTNNETWIFSRPKFEIGNKATDWTPAPEDVDDAISNVQSNLTNFTNTVNGAFKDGIIQTSEATAIEQNLNLIQSDKAQLDKDYSSISTNASLTGTPKTNLANAKGDYDSKYTALINAINTAIADKKATDAEAAAVNAAFANYKTSIGTFKQRFQEALDAISSKKVDDIGCGMRNLILLSDAEYTNSSYPTSIYKFGDIRPVEGEEYTIQIKGQLGTGKVYFGIYNSGGSVQETLIYPADRGSDGVYRKTFTWKITSGSNVASNTELHVYAMLSSVVVNTSIEWIKLEKGNKPSEYTKAPEDTDSLIDRKILEQSSSIIKTTESIILEALTSYTETDDFGSFKETMESQLELMSNQMTLKFEQTNNKLEEVNGDLQDKINTITKYFTFDINGLTIGQVDNPHKVIIDNDRFSMTVNDVEILWIANGQVYTPEISISKKINMFGYSIEQDENGNMNCKYVGG